MPIYNPPPATTGGGGTADIKAVTVNVAAPALSKSFIISDASVSPSSQIIPGWGNVLDTDTNDPEFCDVGFKAYPGSGNLVLVLFTRDQQRLFGDYKVNYLVG